MHRDLESALFTEAQIKERVGQLAEQLSREYEGRYPLIVGILKGSWMFVADLVRAMSIDCQVDFMSVSSYGSDTRSSGRVRVTADLSSPINGRDVIIVEDILDSGHTLSFLKDLMLARSPASVRICTLLDKPERRVADITADWSGFDIPDAFVVGYGMDFAERYRSLPYIGVLKPQVYQS